MIRKDSPSSVCVLSWERECVERAGSYGCSMEGEWMQGKAVIIVVLILCLCNECNLISVIVCVSKVWTCSVMAIKLSSLFFHVRKDGAREPAFVFSIILKMKKPQQRASCPPMLELLTGTRSLTQEAPNEPNPLCCYVRTNKGSGRTPASWSPRRNEKHSRRLPRSPSISLLLVIRFNQRAERDR